MNLDLTSPPPPRNKRAFGITDLLPAAMIKDLRQSMRSPLTLSLVLLSLLAIYLLGMPPVQEVDESSASYCAHVFKNWEFLLIGVSIYLCFFVSMHASSVVAADIKERGSNFLRLCPLSAGRIIGGQFLSCALQLVILTLALVPLYLRYMEAAAPEFSWVVECFGLSFPAYYLVFFILFIQFFFALCSVAVSMVFAHLPLMVRLVIPCCMVGLITLPSHINNLFDIARYSSSYNAANAATMILESLEWGSLLFLLSIAALLLARRHYSAAVEMRSGLLRLICLFFPVLFVLWLYLGAYSSNPMHITDLHSLGFLFLLVPTVVLLLDELLPRDLLPPSAKRPCLLRRCCTSMHLTWMLLCFALVLGSCWVLIPKLDLLFYIPQSVGDHCISACYDASQSPIVCSSAHLVQPLLYLAMTALMMFSSVVIVLALTDLFVSQKSKWRLLAFVIAGILLLIFDMTPAGDGIAYWPIINFMELSDYATLTTQDFIIMGGITALALLALINIRAFRRS